MYIKDALLKWKDYYLFYSLSVDSLHIFSSILCKSLTKRFTVHILLCVIHPISQHYYWKPGGIVYSNYEAENKI